MPRLFWLLDRRPEPPAREVELIGGPADGRRVTVRGRTNAVRIPLMARREPLGFVEGDVPREFRGPEWSVVEYEQVPGLNPDCWHLVTGAPRRDPPTPPEDHELERIPTLYGWLVLALGTAAVLTVGAWTAHLIWG
ncbi:MAG: hypothetical protein KIS74_02955 [Burkholderiales bacterium]|nr:hypothetical protein [Burkholderiales bacterium]